MLGLPDNNITVAYTNETIQIDNKYMDAPFDNKPFVEYSQLAHQIATSRDEDIIYIMKNRPVYKYDKADFVLDYYNMTGRDSIRVVANSDESRDNCCKFVTFDNEPVNITDKYNNIVGLDYDMPVSAKLNKLAYCDRELETYKLHLYRLYHIYNRLAPGGNYICSVVNYCSWHTIELIYLLALLFDKVTIYDGEYVICHEFKPNVRATLATIESAISNGFNIEPKPGLPQLLENITQWVEYQNKINRLLISKREDEYLEAYYMQTIDRIMASGTLATKFSKYVTAIRMHLIKHLKRVIIDNKLVKIHSNVNYREGEYIQSIVRDSGAKKCLEIGMAFGTSAVYILSTIGETGFLISIDPFQSTQWNNNGVNNVKEFGFTNHMLYEKKNYYALPELLEKYKYGYFDFIFIDGWHTFDYTLVDFFYSDMLLKVGGYIIIDDAMHPGVTGCVNYLKTNYPHFVKQSSPNTVACFKKINNDKREWNFHRNF